MPGVHHKGRPRRDKVVTSNVTTALYNSIAKEAEAASESLSSMSGILLRIGLRAYTAADRATDTEIEHEQDTSHSIHIASITR
jgi:hypothetical protein